MNTNTELLVNLPLFDFASHTRLCQICGIVPLRERQERFCGIKCKNAFHHKATDAKLRAANLANLARFETVYIEPENPRDKAICDDYRKGISWPSIAKICGIDKAVVRKVLIKAGIYKPNKKQNGFAKRGTGQYSRIARALSRTLRPQLSPKQRQIKGRNAAAKILREMKRTHEKAASIARRLNISAPLHILKDSAAYTKLREASRIHTAGAFGRYSRSMAISAAYASEAVFCDRIEAALRACGVPYKREVDMQMWNASYDFNIASKVLCECKIDMRTKTSATCIGQCVRYANEWPGLRILLLPDDVCVNSGDVSLLQGLMQIVREGELIEWLTKNNATR